MKNASATQPVSVTIDGHPALQDELIRTEKGTSVVLLHTTVDDGDHFQQILASTLKPRWHQPRTPSGLREVTQTLRGEPVSRWDVTKIKQPRRLFQTGLSDLTFVTGKNSATKSIPISRR